jgi:hypothetical protein
METQIEKTNGKKSGQTVLLPSIADLYKNDALPTLQKTSLFQVLVNQEPKPDWVKVHPMTKQKYIPIERIEWLLTNIFLKKRVEIKWSKQIANSVEVCVRLHYYNHLEKEWNWEDGIGASPLQVDKGAGAIEWDKIKSSAVQMALPSAESYAVKDAAQKIGKLFGRDLNRGDATNYDSLKDKYSNILDE